MTDSVCYNFVLWSEALDMTLREAWQTRLCGGSLLGRGFRICYLTTPADPECRFYVLAIGRATRIASAFAWDVVCREVLERIAGDLEKDKIQISEIRGKS